MHTFINCLLALLTFYWIFAFIFSIVFLRVEFKNDHEFKKTNIIVKILAIIAFLAFAPVVYPIFIAEAILEDSNSNN